MFKRFLTHQFALSFDRACSLLELPAPAREELLRCSRSVLHHLECAGRAAKIEDEAKSLFVSVTYLRDCRAILDAAGITDREVLGPYGVLHGRLEAHCLEVAGGEGGQLRMLG